MYGRTRRLFSVAEDGDHEDEAPAEEHEEAPEEQQQEEEEEGEEQPSAIGALLKPGESTVEDLLRVLHPQTPAYNPHFPNTNQTKHCWSSFINFSQCAQLKGEDDEECLGFYNSARALCPEEWLDAWAEAKEESKFASPYAAKNESDHHH